MTTIRFVTGTDTGVGKTVVSSVLARRSIEQGASVRYVKPLQTGDDDDAALVRAAGIDARTLLRFPAPLAPAVAAELSGETIDFEELVRETLACGDGVDVLYVEGAGGLLVPITEKHTMADFAEALGAELIVVVRPGLGTLNHTALTIEAAQRRGMRVAKIVVSGYTGGLTEETNLEQLRALGPRVEIVKRVPDRV